jgi:hypothetical protein
MLQYLVSRAVGGYDLQILAKALVSDTEYSFDTARMLIIIRYLSDKY